MNTAGFLHRRVRFLVNDVCVPTPSEVLSALFLDQMIEGEVVDYTSSGDGEQCFVVVRVRELPPLLVVPVMKISVIESQHG